jgi:23S rRNA pseudouridine1911/1915/1917 synthase
MVTVEEFTTRISTAISQIYQISEPRIFSLSVKKRYHSSTLLDMYSACFPHVSRDFWEDKITSGNLTVDGQSATPNQTVRAGQITQHTVEAKPEPVINGQIQLLHAEPGFWIIDKPSPLPVHAGGRYQNHTLTNILKTAFPNQSFYLVNRLDANTTGIVLVATQRKTARILGMQFENKIVRKTYLALVEGHPNTDNFSSAKEISKTKTPAGGREIAEGKSSDTAFSVLKNHQHTSLLKVVPSTGRTNQIRLHLADLGHPIVGDLGYKNRDFFQNNPLTYPSDSLFLHAWKLEFQHPDSLQNVHFSAAPGEKWTPFIENIPNTLK